MIRRCFNREFPRRHNMNRSKSIGFRCILIFSCASIPLLACSAKAATFSLLHTFAGGTNDGISPNGLTIVGSTFYGTTASGGTSNQGTIFMLNPATDAESVVYSFSGGQIPGSPLTSSTNDPSLLYAQVGGALISYNINTGVENPLIIARFPGNRGPLIQVGNLFYGYGDEDALFSFNPQNNAMTTFSNAPPVLNGPVIVNNMVYGNGGGSDGSLVSYNLGTGVTTPIHAFAGGVDGGAPFYLTASGNMLYGVTEASPALGLGLGTIFSYNISTGTYQTLLSFSSSTGGDPDGPLLVDGTTLYGSTQMGPEFGVGNGGAVFSLDTTTDTYTLLH